MATERRHVIVTGTDPASGKGGIAFATCGYLGALKDWGVTFEHIATHHPDAWGGKWWWWLRALPLISLRILQARSDRRPVTVYSHTGAGISFFREGIVQLLARSLGARAVLHVHAPELINYVENRRKRVLVRIAMWPSNAICFLTPWWVQLAARARLHRRIFVVPNPLPRSWERTAISPRPAREMGPNSDIFVLIMTRIEAGKGVDLAIDAIANSSDRLKLRIAGDGSQLSVLRDYVSQHGLAGRVEFLGWVSGDVKDRLLRETDIFCLPTQLDAMPMSILEAMAYGLPIVALKWGPIVDLVPHRKVGVLATASTADAVAQALDELLDNKVRVGYGASGKALVLRNYSSRIVSQRLRQFLTNDSEA